MEAQCQHFSDRVREHGIRPQDPAPPQSRDHEEVLAFHKASECNGIEEAKKKGIIGRKTKMTAENVHKIYKLKQENVSVLEISRKIQCSPATIYRVLRQEFDYPSEAGISILKDD